MISIFEMRELAHAVGEEHEAETDSRGGA
jgi:hypothetical protein